MAPDEQQRLQSQMQRWSQLTPQQRQQAREQFRSLNQLPPEQRRDVQRKWQEYQSLPPEQRRELASQPAPAKPPAKGSASTDGKGRPPGRPQEGKSDKP
jgi:hypothetical protein